MKVTRQSICAAAAAAATAAGCASFAAAVPFSYDLRAPDGSHEIGTYSTGVFTLELWGRVSGTDGTNTNEGLTNSIITIMSTQTDGGAITAGGIVSAVLAPGFNETGSRAGGGSDLNGDLARDWGATTTVATNTNYMLARTAVIGGQPGGGTLGTAVDPNTWEFKIATFTVDVQASGIGVTEYHVVQPAAKNTVGPITYATSRVDGTLFNVNSSNNQGAYAASLGVAFLSGGVPEPATLGLVGAAAIGLLGRRLR